MMKTDEMVNAFILSCRADGLSPATVKWYESLLTRWASENENRTIESIQPDDMRRYIVGLRDQSSRYIGADQRPEKPGGYSRDTIAGHVRALHRLWSWAADEYDINNPMRNIKRTRQAQPMPRNIAPDDFVKLFESTGDGPTGARDRAILAVLADTGVRLGGLVNMRRDALDLHERRAWTREKGGRRAAIYFSRITARLLAAWLASAPPGVWLWVNIRTGEHLTPSGIYELLKRLKKRAGVEGRVNPHSFRHNFAREYIKAGGDVVTLARLLGHQDVRTTADYYAVFTPDELAEFQDKHTPLGKMLSGDNPKNS